MKSGRTHRVPLSRAALAVLEPLHAARTGPFVFPGARAGTHLARAALRKALERVGVDGTVHGFRSTFRDWASETTSFPHEVCEQALAHTIGNKTEAAYRRGDLFEKRRKLMETWAAYCEPTTSNVIALRSPT